MSSGGDKLKISWDDIRTTEVDDEVKRQEALQRAQANYSNANPYQSVAVQNAVPGSGSSLSTIVYSPWFYMTLFGVVGGFIGWFVAEVAEFFLAIFAMGIQDEISFFLFGYLSTAITLGIVGVSIAFFLSIADPLMGRNLRGAIVNGCVGVAIAGILSVIGAVIANFVFQVISAFADDSLLVMILARTIGWTMVGATLAIAPGIVMRSWKRFGIGLVGGTLGGFVGGLLFDPLYFIIPFDIASRFVGEMAIGTLAGAATGLIEVAAKSGWVRVTQGLIVGKQFIFYKKATTIGSTPECDIYLFKDPSISARHAVIHAVSGGYDVEDLGSATGTYVNDKAVKRVRLRSGDLIRVGGTTLAYQERAKS